MKKVVTVCLCLLLCLRADASPLPEESATPPQLELIFDLIFNMEKLEAKKKIAPDVWLAARPCMEDVSARTDSDLMKDLEEFALLVEKCLEAAGDDKRHQEALFDKCFKENGSQDILMKGPRIIQLAGSFDQCVRRGHIDYLKTRNRPLP